MTSQPDRSIFMGLCICIVFCGCAHTRVTQFSADIHGVEEKEDRGVRFYQNAPFVLVYADKGKYNSEVVFLPDKSVIYTAKPKQLFATAELNLVLEDGVLTKLSESGDSTKLPIAFIEAVKSLAMAQVQAQTGLLPIEAAGVSQNISGVLGLLDNSPTGEKVDDADSGAEMAKIVSESAIPITGTMTDIPEALLAVDAVAKAAEKCGEGTIERSLSAQLGLIHPSVYIYRVGVRPEPDNDGNWTPVLYSDSETISLDPSAL